MKRIRSVVRGVGSYLPERVVTNRDLEALVETSHEWIVQRTGIEQRHIAADHETTSLLGIKAAEPPRGCRDEGEGYRPHHRRNLDAGLHVPVHGDDRAGRASASITAPPSTCRPCAPASSTLCRPPTSSSPRGRTSASSSVPRRSRASSIGRTAPPACSSETAPAPSCLKRRKGGTPADRGVLTAHLRSDGRHRDKLYVDGGPGSTKTTGVLKMEGREVFRFAVGSVTDVIREAFEATGTTAEDLAWFVPHQANKRIITASADKPGSLGRRW